VRPRLPLAARGVASIAPGTQPDKNKFAARMTRRAYAAVDNSYAIGLDGPQRSSRLSQRSTATSQHGWPRRADIIAQRV